MRFSTVVAAATFIGMVVSNPVNIVYETEIVTITSCAPEKPNCPYATAPPVVEEPEVIATTTCTDEEEYPVETDAPMGEDTEDTEEGPEVPEDDEELVEEDTEEDTEEDSEDTLVPSAGFPQTYPNSTATYEVPSAQSTGDIEEPASNDTDSALPYTPSATPSLPPAFENNANKMGASFIAIVGVAAFAIFA